MVELFHHHHNQHDNDDHGPTHDAADPAGQSLADALRVSFRLLSVIMIVVLFFYLLTGVKTVSNSQVGIKKVFGKIVGLAQPGLAYTWPFPVGNIEIVDTREQRLTISDFWLNETAEQKTQPLLSRQYLGGGLNPGLDGALLTGDRSLLHVRLECRYVIREPMIFAIHVGNAAGGGDAVAELVRSTMCRAAIRAAAVHTADGLQRADRNAFASAVRTTTQEELKALDSGIEVISVLMTDSTWPLGALSAYIEAQNAVSEAEKLKDSARAEAVQILNQATGANYRKLVGDAGLENLPISDSAALPATQAAPAEYNLIGQYQAARADGNDALAEQLLQRIDEVLRSRETSGEASKIIADAETNSLATVQRVQGRVKKFNQLLPSFNKTPDLTLENLWLAVREEILSSPTVEKFYITPGGDKTVLKINRDPEVARDILRELKAQAKAEKDRPQN
jgi:regulator of protease activity HflC (stomatin/prohibitin superfamily)